LGRGRRVAESSLKAEGTPKKPEIIAKPVSARVRLKYLFEMTRQPPEYFEEEERVSVFERRKMSRTATKK